MRNPASAISDRIVIGLCLLVAIVVATTGCQRADSGADTSAQSDRSSRQAAVLAADDYWDAFYIQGSKVGYTHTSIAHADDAQQPLMRIETLSKLSVLRFGERNEQELRAISFETPAGQVVRWELHSSLGGTPVVTKGRVEADRMIITNSDGSPEQSIAWPADARGFGGVEQSLAASPMLPGERRTLQLLLPLVNQVGTAELTAGEIEDVPMLLGSQKLLRIDSVLKLPGGNELTNVLWTDARGRALKTRMAAMQQETFRTTRDLALAPEDGKEFDLGADVLVKIEPPLTNPHGSKKIVYDVELNGGDPAEVFAKGPSQQVEPRGPNQARVTVTAIRPADKSANNEPANKSASPFDKTSEFLTPNSIVQSDDPLVVKMAGAVAEGESDPWRVAIALEKHVHDSITAKNFSKALSTASQVAATLEGDCTEHAVLLAALARARGIPARVAIGLVYVTLKPGVTGFGYHMWTEVNIDGVWIPLDATLGRGGIGGAHLKLGDTSLQGATALSSLLPVAQVMGRLKVKVVSEE